jgi:uncharacterized protein (DUF433 family)
MLVARLGRRYVLSRSDQALESAIAAQESLTMSHELGKYIVADPKICHGQPTFRGTRVLVADVLEQVAMGMDWQAIVDGWRGTIDRRAIAEAIRLASGALLSTAEKKRAAS